MARLTYAALALALGALVGGFFVRTSAAPLFASIGFSILVLVLILTGWARRLRHAEGMLGDGGEEPEIQELESEEIVLIEPEDKTRPTPRVPAAGRSRSQRIPPAERLPPRPRSRPTPVAPPTPAARPTAPGGSKGRRVVILPGRTRYHTPDCRFARGKGAREVAESTARRRRYEPCSVCLGG